jgi:hypothetical protein
LPNFQEALDTYLKSPTTFNVDCKSIPFKKFLKNLQLEDVYFLKSLKYSLLEA